MKKTNVSKNSIVQFSPSLLKRKMENMINEQKYPLSIIFKHFAFLAQTKYFDAYQIDEVNPRSAKSSVLINVSIMRKLMDEFQSPKQTKKKFISDFIDQLWVDKINAKR